MSPNDTKTARATRRRPGEQNVVLVSLAAGLGVVSCMTEDVDWQDDGGTSTVRPDARAESGPTMDAGGPPMCPTGPLAAWCTMPVSVSTAVIADFTAPPLGTPSVFGIYGNPVWGGVYAYPAAAADPCTDAAPPAYPISSDMRNNEWRVTGMLGTYSGFGLWWNCTVGGNLYPVCVLDVSAYSGIRFSIHGDPGPTGTLILQMRTADNTPVPMDPSTSSCGQCVGACTFATKTIPVTSARTTVSVPWTELTGGAPNAFDPHRVTGIEWQFPYSGMGTYPIDLAIDDIELLR
jgi:hypothetical protein